MVEYPVPVCHFSVEWGGKRIGFAEVSGLDMEVQVIEYREGASPQHTAAKMPGILKYGNITFKRGIIPGDNDFFNWFNTIRLNHVERRDVVIKLLNENHEPVMVWKARNAFPVKLQGPVLNAASGDVAVKTLEIAHEGLTVES